ncbi:MAG TPA: protein kinase, partial [Polyangiaceae bacterium]
MRLIGEGGMGAVYEAHHEHLDSQVALKFLHPDLQASPALVARFLQEARVSASIKSPHVTHVIDVDQTPEGAAYLVMELLEGVSLERRMERQMPLPF